MVIAARADESSVPQIAASLETQLKSRAGLDYMGAYKTKSSKFQRALQWLSRAIVTPSEDHLLGWLIRKHYSGLDAERDNRSVTNPEWVAEGLARYGCPIHSTHSSTATQFTVPGIGACSCRRREYEGHKVHGSVHPDRGWGYDSARPRSGNGNSDRPVVYDAGTSVRPQRVGDRSPKRPRPWDTVAYRNAIAATYSVAGSQTGRRKPLDVVALAEDSIDPQAYAGAPLFDRNREVLDSGIQLARKIMAGKRGFDPYMAGRRVQPGPRGPKTRLVWMAPLPTTLVGGTFSKPISKAMERRRPFCWGLHGVEKAGLVAALQSRFRYVYSLDFSGFDSSVPARMIADAFAVCRTYLDLDDAQQNLWERYINDFIHSRLITEKGEVYQKHRGVPSGSAFTSIIDSVVNLILLNYMWLRVSGSALKADRVLVLGDDAVVASNVRLPLDRLAQAASELGFTLSVDKSSVADSSRESKSPYENRVHFLGHYWVHGYPRRPIHEVLQRMVYPERHAYRPKQLSLTRQYCYLADSREAWEILRWSYNHADTMQMLTHALDDIGDDGSMVAEYDLPGQLRLALKISERNDLIWEPGRGLLLGITGLWRV